MRQPVGEYPVMGRARVGGRLGRDVPISARAARRRQKTCGGTSRDATGQGERRVAAIGTADRTAFGTLILAHI